MEGVDVNETTHVEIQAFEVEDDTGNRNVVVRTEPVSEDKEGNPQTVRLGVDWRLRTGETVMPLSETEFETADGRRWRTVK
jgi:hypothetical protein